jgi:hypothetical protein
MEQRLVDLLNGAQRWSDGGRDFLPTLGCSSCGKGCMPLCGLGINRKVSPMESKDIVLKSRKTMLETGKLVAPVDLQIVSSTGIVIMYERAMDCIHEREEETEGAGAARLAGGGGGLGNKASSHPPPTKKRRWVFTQPIPTMAGLLCADCRVCAVCGQPAEDERDRVKLRGRWVRACAMCVEPCPVCRQGRLKHHNCCENRATAKYFSSLN